MRILFMFVLATSAFGQTAISIEEPFKVSKACGTVIDVQDAPIAGASVVLLKPTKSTLFVDQVALQTTKTSNDGKFCFSKVKGTHRLRIYSPGMQTLFVTFKVTRFGAKPAVLKMLPGA